MNMRHERLNGTYIILVNLFLTKITYYEYTTRSTRVFG